MSNEYDFTEVANVVKQTAFNVAGMNEQMGLMKSAIDNLKIGHARLEDKVISNEDEFGRFKESLRQRERVEAEEVQEYDDAIRNRIGDMLGQRNRMDLYGAFARKCWIDSKRHSYMRGKSGVDTKRMYHNDVLNYIGTWEPYGYGVDGYIHHIDESRVQ